jgi:hypothetical protein
MLRPVSLSADLVRPGPTGAGRGDVYHVSADLPLVPLTRRPASDQSAPMSDARAWRGELGYDIEVEVADGFTWVALRPRTNPNFVIPRYGRRRTGDGALESAARRYRVEQIGTDNAHKPGEPLP